MVLCVLFWFLLQRPESVFTVAIPVDTDKSKEKKVVTFVFGTLKCLSRKVFKSWENTHWVPGSLI